MLIDRVMPTAKSSANTGLLDITVTAMALVRTIFLRFIRRVPPEWFSVVRIVYAIVRFLLHHAKAHPVKSSASFTLGLVAARSLLLVLFFPPALLSSAQYAERSVAMPASTVDCHASAVAIMTSKTGKNACQKIPPRIGSRFAKRQADAVAIDQWRSIFGKIEVSLGWSLRPGIHYSGSKHVLPTWTRS
ncbi:MAG: hypothetical protein H6957_03455 [Chromatiaceae bacterium]|nr:hypothetical protein [Chromatiaceae bacterium]